MNIIIMLINKFKTISLKSQLALIIITTFSCVIIMLIFYNYYQSSITIITQQQEQLSKLVDLENQAIDAYIAEIDRYSLLLRYDATFMQTIQSKKTLTYEDDNHIRSILKSHYNSRNDLISYKLYLSNKFTNYTIDPTEHRVSTFTGNPQDLLPDYSLFTQGRYYRYIKSSKENGSFIRYYRTIINIEDQSPLAIIELTLDSSYIDALINRYHTQDENIYLFNENTQLLYAYEPGKHGFLQRHLDSTFLSAQNPSANYQTSVNNENFLIVSDSKSNYNYTLVAVKPLQEIEQKLATTRNISFLLAALAIFFTTLFVIIFIHLVTKPLSTLSNRLQDVGTGNFSVPVDVGGSKEIATLSCEYNIMIQEIDSLIKKTYVSELNEKTAQLIALEAQINPHFLYNTLQAISTEAVINNQSKINYMITALASMLRYSIKGSDFSLLSQEIKHVKDYLLLQHARFDDNLEFSLDFATDTLNMYVPKISLQTLVENAIIHGMKGTHSSIRITIQSSIIDHHLVIHVTDNGQGITANHLNELLQQLNSPAYPLHSNSNIGLKNLNSRLQLMYNNKANLTVESVYDKFTRVTLTVPIQKEDKHV